MGTAAESTGSSQIDRASSGRLVAGRIFQTPRGTVRQLPTGFDRAKSLPLDASLILHILFFIFLVIFF
jgi:hypothetical protein